MEGGLKPAPLVVQTREPITARIDAVVLGPAEERVREIMRAADEIKPIVVTIHEVGGVIGTFDEGAVAHCEVRAGVFAAGRAALHEKTGEVESAAIKRMPQLAREVDGGAVRERHARRAVAKKEALFGAMA